MAVAKLSLAGVQDTLKQMERLRGPVFKKVLRTALRAGAKVVLAEAKSLAPVRQTAYPAKADRTPGSLRNSLKVRSGKSKTGAAMLVQTRAGDFKGAEFYAGFLEYGTKARFRKVKSKRKGATGATGLIKPQAFMKRAMDSKRAEATAVIASELRAGLAAELSR